MKKLIAILILLAFCNHSKEPSPSVFQVSNFHGKNERDSILLKKNVEQNQYQEIEIYRNGKLLFHYLDTNLQIIGYPGFVCTEFGKWEKYYYIFECFNAPQPHNFVVVCVKPSGAFLLGITPSCTGEIFGDIDYDGVFKIGGFEDYNQPGGKLEDNYIVFRIDSGFPEDIKIRSIIKELMKKKQ